MAQNRSDRGSFITVWPRIVQKIDGFCVTTDDDKSLCALDAPLLACAHRSPTVTISLRGENSIAGLREQDVAKRLAYKYDSLKSRTTWMAHNSMQGSKKASTTREDGFEGFRVRSVLADGYPSFSHDESGEIGIVDESSVLS